MLLRKYPIDYKLLILYYLAKSNGIIKKPPVKAGGNSINLISFFSTLIDT